MSAHHVVILGCGPVGLMAIIAGFLLMMVGAFLGSLDVAISVFFGSVFALIVFGPISYFTKRLIPLGIFLAAGAALAYGWGDALWGWYSTTLLGVG